MGFVAKASRGCGRSDLLQEGPWVSGLGPAVRRHRLSLPAAGMWVLGWLSTRSPAQLCPPHGAVAFWDLASWQGQLRGIPRGSVVAPGSFAASVARV